MHWNIDGPANVGRNCIREIKIEYDRQNDAYLHHVYRCADDSKTIYGNTNTYDNRVRLKCTDIDRGIFEAYTEKDYCYPGCII